MCTRYHSWKQSWFVIIFVALLGLGWTVALGASSSENIVSPGYRQDVEAGSTAIYHHVITNTGDVAGILAITVQIPTGWDITYAITSSPGTTIWVPIPVASGVTLPLTISLRTPYTAKSGLYTSTITMTLLFPSTSVSETIYEETYIHNRFIYLPLVLRNYAPFRNGSFENDLSGWTVPAGAKLPVNVVNVVKKDNTEPSNGEKMALLGDPDYPCASVPLGYAAVEQTFVVPTNTSLMFDYIIWSQDASLNKDYDRFEVYIWKAGTPMPAIPVHYDGNMIAEGGGCNVWRRVPAENWKSHSIEMTDYYEQMVTVSFRVYNRQDNWYNTYAYLDNVHLVSRGE